MNEIKTRRTILNPNKTKSCFIKNIYKLDNSSNTDKKEDINYQHQEQNTGLSLQTLDEIDQFLKKHKLPELIIYETDSLNNPIFMKETKFVN